MNQETTPQTIQKEIELIRQLAGLDDTVTVEFNDAGWTSRVYLINDGEIVFKFPRREEVKKEYVWEVLAYELLSALNLSVRFPELCWRDPDFEYLGYKGVRGSNFDEIITNLPTPQKEVVGRSLGDFLRQFHQLDLVGANVITLEDEVAEAQEKFLMGANAITQKFTASEFENIKSFVCEKYPSQMLSFSFDKVLCHGDLGFWNIIYQGKDQVGVIDFGDVGYYDRSIDFAGMFDEVTLESALQTYGKTSDELLKKVELRMLLMPIVDLPFFLGKDDKLGIEKTISRIRANLGRY